MSLFSGFRQGSSIRFALRRRTITSSPHCVHRVRALFGRFVLLSTKVTSELVMCHIHYLYRPRRYYIQQTPTLGTLRSLKTASNPGIPPNASNRHRNHSFNHTPRPISLGHSLACRDSWGRAISLGPTKSTITSAVTPLIPGARRTTQNDMLSIWPGMSNGTGDLVQTTLESWPTSNRGES